MSAPPSYKSTSSLDHLTQVAQNLTIDDKQALFDSESLHTTNTENDVASTLVDPTPSVFSPTKILTINAKGMPLLRFPCPSSELQIPIHNSDGSLAYVSTRAKRRSGDAVLSSPERGDLIASYYRWGPGRPPSLRVLGSAEGEGEIGTESKWTSRAQRFVGKGVPVAVEWRYRREVPLAMQKSGQMKVKQVDDKGKKQKQKKQSVLALEVPGASKKESVRIAQLVRDEETRTEGTNSVSAGNGGALAIDSAAAQDFGVLEEVIVSTCIMMLKKEMDRRRTTQIAMMSGAAGN